MEGMLTNVDVEALLAELSEAVSAKPLDRSRVLDLIARGADPNYRDKGGSTWFARAFWGRDLTVEAVELLIEAGADVNADGEDGLPLYNACLEARPDLVECLLAHGADPNILIEEVETVLDYVEFDRRYCEGNIGTAWERDYQRPRIEALSQIVTLLLRNGARRRSGMRASRLRDWVTLTAGGADNVSTRDGRLRLSDIAGLSEDWVARWRAWCGQAFDPADEDFLAAPPGFDRRRHNAEGLALAREFKQVAGAAVRVDFGAIDPDSEEAFARNICVVSDVGGREVHPSLSYSEAQYIEQPGFYVVAKACVAGDLSAVTPVLEFHVGRQRRFVDWTLQLDEILRSCAGDGRYTIFADVNGVPVDVWVTWTDSEVRWHIPRVSPESTYLTFKRAGYEEAVRHALVTAHHAVRRAWIAVDKHRNRTPRITGLGAVKHAMSRDGPVPNQLAYRLSSSEAEVAARSRI
jgi:hypothetical protein